MKGIRLFLLLLVFGAHSTRADSASWASAPGSGDWNTPANWTPNTVPNASSATATFATSSVTAVSISADTEVNGIIFNNGASAFNITAAPTHFLTISGAGIVNNSSVAQNFVSAINSVGQWGAIWLTNSATAGSLTTFTNQGTAPDRLFPGHTEFFNNSTAGSATIINDKTQVSLTGGTGGYTQFWNNSTAGSANITNVSGSANGESGGFTYFNDSANAGKATFTINGPSATGASGGQVRFLGNSSGANALFNVNGSSAAFTNPGILMFSDNSTAGSALINGNAGTNSGTGGLIYFFGDSSGDTARVQLTSATLDVSSHTANVSIAQLAGSGSVILGLTNLILGGNNVSTTISALIQTGSGATGGSLTKIGTGTLTLSNANTHSGTTTLDAGNLKLTNSLALQNSTVVPNVSGIVFDSSVTSHAFTFGGLGGTADLTLLDNATTPHAIALTVGNNNTNSTFSGRLRGNGSLTKIGSGSLILSGLNDYTGATVVNGGTLQVDGSLGNSSSVTVNSGGTLTGTGTINGAITVNSGGIVDLVGGTLTVNNKITNNGLFILSSGAQLAGVTSFVNNGTLDIITDGPFTPPTGFVNHGTILDASVVKVKAVVRGGSTAFTAVIDSYTGHSYQLQKSLPPNINLFSDVPGTPAQQGRTGNELDLTDLNATETAAFYRVFVNP